MLASGLGIGACFSSIAAGNECVIAYYSKTLTLSEKTYCLTWHELLAALEAVKHVCPCLCGQLFKLINGSIFSEIAVPKKSY